MFISKQRRIIRAAIQARLQPEKLAWLLGVSLPRAEKLIEQEKLQMELDRLK